ncbi:MAG: lytic transglycosylase domain-containing protein [Janthinobacterium lividum]
MLSCKLLTKCLLLASLQNDVPPEALLAIMEVEGGRVGLEVRNSNGSHDLGLMQINTLWLTYVAKTWELPHAQVRMRLKTDNCFNLKVAAHILKLKIKEGNGTLIDGIARYNHASPRYNHPYRQKVLKAYRRQQQSRSS